MSSIGKKRVRDGVTKSAKKSLPEDLITSSGFEVFSFDEEKEHKKEETSLAKSAKKGAKPKSHDGANGHEEEVVDLGRMFQPSSSGKSKKTKAAADSAAAATATAVPASRSAPVAKKGALQAAPASALPTSSYKPPKLSQAELGKSSLSTSIRRGVDEYDEDEEVEEDVSAIRSSSKKLGNLLGDSDVEADDVDMGRDEEDEEDDDDDDQRDDGDLDGDSFAGGDIVKAQKKLDIRRARIAQEAEQELMLAHAGEQEQFSLPTEEELEEERARPPNLPTLKRRISDLVHLLQDFRSRRDPLRSRAEYVECLAHDFSDFYGYNRELVDLFLQLFSPTEALEFFEANETPRPVVIRVNTLKTKRRDLMQALMNRGVNLEPVGGWTKVGLKVFESPVPIGATPEYLAGHYMLQSAASLWPVIALDPQPGERVVDLASAPGGKTSHIAQLQGHTGVLVANDLKKQRIASLQANLTRLGVTNSVICCMDGRKLPDAIRSFDRALLDAPCTGLGVLARDPAARTQKSMEDVLKMAQLQKQLILAAIDCVDAHSKSGGVIVYSTCSVAVEENEAVVNYALRKRNVRLVPFLGEDGSDVGRPGFTAYASGSFHPDLRHTRRFYPHVHNMDGFFVAKLKKISNDIPSAKNDDRDEEEEEQHVRGGSRDSRHKQYPVQEEEEDEEEEEEEEEVHFAAKKRKKTSFNEDEAVAIRHSETKNVKAISTKPTSSSSTTSKLVAAAALPISQLGAQIADVSSRTKNKRLPAERTTPAEREMQRKVSALVFGGGKSLTSSSSSSSAIANGEDEEMEEEKNQTGPSVSSAATENGDSGAVFDFLKPGEKVHSKKRKAGKKVAAQKEAKRGGGGGGKSKPFSSSSAPRK